MSSWTTCPCCGRMIGIRKNGAFRVHVRNGSNCPGSGRTVAQILQRGCECGGTLPHPDCPIHATNTTTQGDEQ